MEIFLFMIICCSFFTKTRTLIYLSGASGTICDWCEVFRGVQVLVSVSVSPPS